jgi:CyaY protein
MKDSDFTVKAEEIINKIFEIIEDNDKQGRFDIDLNDGILTMENENGTYVINRQSAAKEIWLSSPVSGPHHFAFHKNRWISSKNGDFFEILTNELEIKIE